MRNKRTDDKLKALLYKGDVLDAYKNWPSPATIISDGAYGVGGFPGDPRTNDNLQDWYRPHVQEWSEKANQATTLWFWNTEVGWANVHPMLVEKGWEYVELITWDKGIAHVAGNVNSETIRQFPVVTEVCAFYRRALTFVGDDGKRISAREWLRSEWRRTGLPLSKANEACGVKNAATRKYLTQDWLWYFPPPEAMEKLVKYANSKGSPKGRPYFSIEGAKPVTGDEWKKLRYNWNHQHAVTNVWTHPPLSGEERLRGGRKRSAPRVYNPGDYSTVHLNQKPLIFMERIISTCTNEGDVVWEPFGGLCSASVAAIKLGRRPFAAERDENFAEFANQRLRELSSQ
jgi:site-specific DNA-methyltransferase (adenine-specific)